ncbi:hypothetical protein TREMEDRAFT_28109 [Tremella mesenterica DSM 1558]|uniref:uncharacterized protein n=1 Tax=Tremella mesenterica (strain ATCC 24925 / CBS 8224 / DSM 1558 / NBRC 9311 / NRRL Y-6157 / RJB 2259-6 / UBC 559-6) TaxID=578456 RepID=UPI0003F49AFA|nr:uncharacterized protein TREMEDRAFT_28109 [Tremella mesenterica DSM 1558]EIW71633.1 hypothetical protein TREMEDRAFT_28109 [Tremella mesenterica DSM 1558]
MNDYSDDSTVKLYLNRRRPNSQQPLGQMPESNSEFSSYSTQLSTVQEATENQERQSGYWSSLSPPSDVEPQMPGSDNNSPKPQAQPRYNPSLTINTTGQSSPERFSSPSARFTVQLRIHASDLPDGSAFDPASEAIIPRAILRERQNNGQQVSTGTNGSQEYRKRLLVMPRNATVLEAIEQALERFGIGEGVVDGGDDVDDRAGRRKSQVKVRYTLSALVNGQGPTLIVTERRLSPSGKLLEAYSAPPNLRPLDRTTPEQRRRSRDMSQGQALGSLNDLLPTDPIFILRRVLPRPGSMGRPAPLDDVALARSKLSSASNSNAPAPKLIAAQRAATLANQKALISAHENQQQGVDVVLPQKGIIRSSLIIDPEQGEQYRYSYLPRDPRDGPEVDVSELLRQEWGPDGTKGSPNIPQAPTLLRAPTDSSVYVTAPSTPMDGLPNGKNSGGILERPESASSTASRDILQTVVARSGAERLQEKLERMIEQIPNNSTFSTSTSSSLIASMASSSSLDDIEILSGRSTPQPSNDQSMISTNDKGQPERPERSSSRMAQTQATVNKIISRHKQQPSIASILSEVSTPHPDDDRSSTPITATSSTHPTPPLYGAVFTRAVASASPTPQRPVLYTDDFGIKSMMAVIEARAREMKPKKIKSKRIRRYGSDGSKTSTLSESSSKEDEEGDEKMDEVERMFYGEKLQMDELWPEFVPHAMGIQGKLDKMDRDIDDLLAQLEVKLSVR